MGLMGAILAGIGGVCAVLGIVTILEVTDTPIISDKLTWGFWFGLAVILLLAAITSLLGRSPGGSE
jgi:uncharacterized protein (TIGR00251 family)